MGNRNMYQRAPKAARCYECGGIFKDSGLVEEMGRLADGAKYRYMLPTTKTCSKCGRTVKR